MAEVAGPTEQLLRTWSVHRHAVAVQVRHPQRAARPRVVARAGGLPRLKRRGFLSALAGREPDPVAELRVELAPGLHVGVRGLGVPAPLVGEAQLDAAGGVTPRAALRVAVGQRPSHSGLVVAPLVAAVDVVLAARGLKPGFLVLGKQRGSRLFEARHHQQARRAVAGLAPVGVGAGGLHWIRRPVALVPVRVAEEAAAPAVPCEARALEDAQRAVVVGDRPDAVSEQHAEVHAAETVLQRRAAVVLDPVRALGVAALEEHGGVRARRRVALVTGGLSQVRAARVTGLHQLVSLLATDHRRIPLSQLGGRLGGGGGGVGGRLRRHRHAARGRAEERCQ